MARKLLDRIRERIYPDDRSLLDGISSPGLEALMSLIEADGELVAADRLCHTTVKGSTRSAGEWASAGRAASVICHLRQVLGPDAVLTVHGKGYVLGALPEGL